MDFRLDEDAVSVAAAVSDVLKEFCSPSVVREQWEATPGSRPENASRLWAALVELGLPRLLVPENLGGHGMDEVTLVGVMEEVGYAAPPLPVAETVLLSPLVARYTAGIGLDALLTWAPDGEVAPWHIPGDALILGGIEGRPLGLGNSDVPGRVLLTVDRARPITQISAESAPIDASSSEIDLLESRAILAASSELIGLSRRMLDMTVDYAKSREQFGKPIGSFQAIKHQLASVAIDLNFARPLAWMAASFVRDGDLAKAHGYVAMAKARSSRLAADTARTAIQCHGGMGYSTEYDLHLYVKRAWALAASFRTVDQATDDVMHALPTLMARD